MTPTKFLSAAEKPGGGFPKWDYNWDKQVQFSGLEISCRDPLLREGRPYCLA